MKIWWNENLMKWKFDEMKIWWKWKFDNFRFLWLQVVIHENSYQIEPSCQYFFWPLTFPINTSSDLARIQAESNIFGKARACPSALPGNTKGGSITVPLTSCLTCLDKSVLQIRIKMISSHTADSKLVKPEVNGTVILPPGSTNVG